MAGHSLRFKKRGYKRPKAFIIIDGKAMIQWVVDMFSPKDQFFFVVLKEHMAIPEFKQIILESASNVQIVEIESHEKGPVHSALALDKIISKNKPLILSYCDFYQHWNYDQFLLKMGNFDGGIAVFKGFHPASFGKTFYAYIRANKNLEMLELREKQSFTNNRHQEFASTGVYYFDSWNLFRKYSANLFKSKATIGNEYYASLIYNHMIKDGKLITLFEVDKFICWGTPDDLEQYFFWSEFFGKSGSQIKNRKFL